MKLFKKPSLLFKSFGSRNGSDSDLNSIKSSNGDDVEFNGNLNGNGSKSNGNDVEFNGNLNGNGSKSNGNGSKSNGPPVIELNGLNFSENTFIDSLLIEKQLIDKTINESIETRVDVANHRIENVESMEKPANSRIENIPKVNIQKLPTISRKSPDRYPENENDLKDWLKDQLDPLENPYSQMNGLRKWILDPPQEEEILPASTLVRRRSSKNRSFEQSHELITANQAEISMVDEELPKLTRNPHLKRRKPKKQEQETIDSQANSEKEPDSTNRNSLGDGSDQANIRESVTDYTTVNGLKENEQVETLALSVKKKKGTWGWLKKLFENPKKDDSDWNPYPVDNLPVDSARLDPQVEKLLYAASHIKLAQPNRPLLQQVLISNFMMYILSVHADVTIRGRGPRARGKGQRRRKRPPPKVVVKPVESESESSSDEDSDEDNVPLAMLQSRVSQPLSNLPSQES